MYAVFVGRASRSFAGSSVAYKARTIKMLYAVLLLHFVVMNVLGVLWTDGSYQSTGRRPDGTRIKEDSDEDKASQVCLSERHPALTTYAAVTDLIITVALVYLFVAPLRQVKCTFFFC